jgi:hypothetical protein
MDARHPRPHLRQGFRHDPLLAWVSQQRGALIWAAMTLVQHWFATGQRLFTARRLGSFERWSGIVGGILEAAGVAGFLSNLESFAAKADDDAADWTAFIGAWWDRYTTTPVTTRALHLVARDTFPALLGDGKTEKAEQTKLGAALKERTGWVFDLPGSGTVTIRRVEPTDKEAPHDDGDDRRRKRPGWALTTDARRDSDAGPSRSGHVRSLAEKSDAPTRCGGPDHVPDLSPGPVTCGTTSGHEEDQEPQAVTETTGPDRTFGLPDDSEVPF